MFNSTLYETIYDETKRNYTGACLRRLLHKNLAVANIARPVHATHSMQIATSYVASYDYIASYSYRLNAVTIL